MRLYKASGRLSKHNMFNRVYTHRGSNPVLKLFVLLITLVHKLLLRFSQNPGRFFCSVSVALSDHLARITFVFPFQSLKRWCVCHMFACVNSLPADCLVSPNYCDETDSPTEGNDEKGQNTWPHVNFEVLTAQHASWALNWAADHARLWILDLY